MDVRPLNTFNSDAVVFNPAILFISAAVAVIATPPILNVVALTSPALPYTTALLFTTVFARAPSKRFISDAEAVSPDRVFNCDEVAVKPLNLFNSVIVVDKATPPSFMFSVSSVLAFTSPSPPYITALLF